jgi:hypothetical protein
MDVYINTDTYFHLAQSGKLVTVKSGNGTDYTNPTFMIGTRYNQVCLKLLLLYETFYELQIPYQYWRYSIVKMMNRYIGIFSGDDLELPLVEHFYGIDYLNTIKDRIDHTTVFRNKIFHYNRTKTEKKNTDIKESYLYEYEKVWSDSN